MFKISPTKCAERPVSKVSQRRPLDAGMDLLDGSSRSKKAQVF